MAIQGNVESRLELRGATLLVTRYDAKTTLKSHTHRDPYVSIVMCGSYTEVRGTAALLCGPGTVLLHDSREVHADYFIEPARLLNIEVGDAQRDRSMATAVESIAASAHCPRAVRAILRRAFSSLRSESSGRTAPAWLDAAVEGLGAHGGHIRGVADRIGVHPTHFARSFKSHVGVAPSFYRARRRVRLASKLLLSTSRRISSIALDCGFSDQSHLTRVFRAIVGMPPATFRAVSR